jgi:predicted membrane protein
MDKPNSSNKRVFFGVFLIALGAFWILERLGIFPDFWNDILISWQMLFIAIGIFSFIGGNKTMGTVLIVIGGFFLIDEVIPIPYELRRLSWPLLVIAVGVVLLFTQFGKRSKEPPGIDPGKMKGADYFDDFVIFGGREVFVNSQNLYGGRTTSVFGGTEYDLRQANLSQNGAVIDCLSIFGGTGFKIPPDWTVINEVTAIFGAFTDKRGSSGAQVISNPSKTLVIKGFAAFGGVEIKHF